MKKVWAATYDYAERMTVLNRELKTGKNVSQYPMLAMWDYGGKAINQEDLAAWLDMQEEASLSSFWREEPLAHLNTTRVKTEGGGDRSNSKWAESGERAYC